MNYTIKVSFYIDSEEILTDNEITVLVKELFDRTAISAGECEILDINDEYKGEQQ